MTSSQYKADSQRAIEEVTLYLTSCCSLNGDGKDAWIFDVDDTLLSTVPSRNMVLGKSNLITYDSCNGTC